jgi:hypothetical protein
MENLVTSNVFEEMVKSMSTQITTLKDNKEEMLAQIKSDLLACESFIFSLGDQIKFQSSSHPRHVFMISESIGISKYDEVFVVEVTDKDESLKNIEKLEFDNVIKRFGASKLREMIFRAISSKHAHYKRINEDYATLKATDSQIAAKAKAALEEKEKAESQTAETV